jgi:hypothetical protein
MMTGLSFAAFNLLEGAFWVCCAGFSLAGIHFIKNLPMRFWQLLAVNFVFFGASDFVEAYYPVSFLDSGGEWLFAWKILCIFGFAGCLIWYVLVRLNK